MKKFLFLFAFLSCLCLASAQTYVYEVGQEVTVNYKNYKVTGTNVVTNGDFADGTYTGWVSTDNANAVDAAYWEISTGGPDGAKYLHNTGKEGGGSGTANNIRCAWDLEAGKTYLVSYWTKGSNANVRFWNSAKEGVETPDNGLALLEGSASEDWMQNIAVFEATAEAHKALLNCAWCGSGFGLTYISIVPVEYVGDEDVELTTIEPNIYYNFQIQNTDLYLSAGWQDNARQVNTLTLGEPGYEQAFKFVPVDGKEGVYNIIGLDGKAIYADGGWDCFWNGEPTEANLADATYQFTVESQVGYILIKTKNKYIGSDGIWNWSKLYTDKGLDKVVKFVPVSPVKSVLWQSDVEEEQSTADWRRVYTMSAEEAKQKIGIGDYLLATVSYVDPNGSWPQVAVMPIDGWPPYTNEGVSKDVTCPYVVRFPIAGPTAKQMWENGFGVSGGEVRISKVELEKATEVLDPNTVWFGGKQCGWGNGISLSKDIFANAKAGDKVVINYGEGGVSLQLLIGGWSAINFPSYAGLPFFVNDAANSQLVFTLQEGFDAYVYTPENGDPTTYDIFALLKEQGLTMHGPTYVNSILYIPAEEPKPAEYTVYFDNSASQWETVYAYAWAGEVNNTWPGQEMTKGENDLWTITFTEFEPENIIFSNGNGKQTEDLVFEDGKTYIGEAPASAKELYFRGSINNWGTSLKFETTDEVAYTLTVSEAIPANTEFKIANADWSVSYTYDAAPIEANVEYTFVDGNGGPGNAKTAADIAAGAKVTFNAETGAFKIEAETDGINAIGADTQAVYYNMQGVRIDAPAAGQPCIRVANGVATKVIVK